MKQKNQRIKLKNKLKPTAPPKGQGDQAQPLDDSDEAILDRVWANIRSTAAPKE